MNFFSQLISKFNQKSLQWASNYPKAWSMGWLTQLCIASILFFLTLIFALIIPIAPNRTVDVEKWFALAFIPAILWWIFIVYRQVKYNSEKLFGDRTFGHNLIELPSYLGQLILPILIPFIMGFVLTYRNANQISEEKINAYKMSFEEAQPFFTYNYGSADYVEYDNYDYRYYYNSAYLELAYFKNEQEYFESILKPSTFGDDFTQLEKNERTLLRDSIKFHSGVFQKNRPMLYPIYFYEFANTPSHAITFDKGLPYYQPDSLKKIYFYENYKDENFIKTKFKKYITNLKEFSGRDFEMDVNQLYNLFREHKYSDPFYTKENAYIREFDELSNRFIGEINYIARCKYQSFFFTHYEFIWGLLMFFTICALILALFKNMDWAEFLVGGVIIALSLILTIIFLVVTRADEEVGFTIFWIEFIVLFIFAVIERGIPIRRKRGAFLLMIPHLFIPFLPLFTLITLDEIFNFWHWSIFDQYLYLNPTVYDPNNMSYNEAYYSLKSSMPFYLLLVGFFTHVLFIYPFWIKPGWMNFIAKPKKS